MRKPPPGPNEWATFAPTPVEGVSLLRAHFVSHHFDRHSHPEWAIGVTFDGNQTFRCRGTTSTSHRGDVIVFRPDDAHDGHAEDAQGFRYAMMYVDDARVSEWLGEAGRPAATFDRALIHDRECAARLARAAAAIAQQGESLRGEALLREATMRLFECHAGHRAWQGRERKTARWLDRVREFLRAHYASDVRVEELATIAGVSRVHLTRAFVDAYGMPPHVYLTSLRLQAATRLMSAGHALAEVAVDAGFADQSHFTRRFKGAFGITPKSWLANQARTGS
jgi:AraC-like DNA-binding protein